MPLSSAITSQGGSIFGGGSGGSGVFVYDTYALFVCVWVGWWGDKFLALGSDIVFLLLTPRVFTVHRSYYKKKKITSLISLIAASTRLLAWRTAATVLTAESKEISKQNPSPSSQTQRLAL